MNNKPPVSSSECSRGCCWTPYGPCARQHTCRCHVRTHSEKLAELRAARARAFDYAILMTEDLGGE